MTPRRLLVLSLAALGALAAAPAAHAADHEAALTAATPKFEWEGAPQISRGLPLYDEAARTAIPCGSPVARPCETALIRVVDAGKLTVKVEGLEGTGGTTDVDVYLYKSDAQGTQGEKISSGAANGPDTVSVKSAAPGYYLVVADYYHSYNSGYKGSATLAAFAPAPVAVPPVTVTPPAPPAPAAKPAAKKKKKASCKTKAKKVKNAKKRKAALKRCAKKARKS